MYTNFYAAPKPVILCEGKTDNVYLVHAIRRLALEFPLLAEIDKDGGIRLRVRLFKHSKPSTTRLLELGQGGSSVLNAFMVSYKKETARFGPGLAGPIIVLYDNDSGASAVRNTLKKNFKITTSSADAFVRVHKNLYAAPTPLPAGATVSEIEDFFDDATRATIVGGKSFRDGDGADPERHYGKAAFASMVVRPNAETIDFTGFRPLLARLSAVIESYRAHE